MKNLSVGLKIGLGFGVLILLSCLLGGMAVLSMHEVRKDAARLADAYVPEVAIANNLERQALLTMYAMRGYALSEQDTFRQEARKEQAEVASSIADAATHAATRPELAKLGADAVKAREQVGQYAALAERTDASIKDMAAQRKIMDESVAKLLQNTTDWAASQSRQLKAEVSNDVENGLVLERFGKVEAFQHIMDLISDIRVRNFKAQAVGDPSLVEGALGHFKKIDALIDGVREKTLRADNLKRLDEITAASHAYEKAVKDLLAAWKTLDDVNARSSVVAQQVLDTARSMAQSGMDDTRKVASESVSDLSMASSVMVGGLVTALVLGVVIAMSLTRVITAPLFRSVSFADKVAGGDLDGRLDVDQRDEVGRLAVSLRTMVGNLKERIREANDRSAEASRAAEKARLAMAEAEKAQQEALAKRDAMIEAAARLQRVAEVTTSASEELSAQIEQSSRGAEQQSARVSETATAMEQMTATVMEVARSAGQAAETSREAREKAQAGAQVVGEVVDGIGQVQKQALALKQDMGSLGAQAEGIGNIMNVISDIADQTNLLALNAAIEAARAGEAGRGFAVVADEVRKLAEKTMQATKEVGEAIQGIQDGTRKNMENVDRAVRTIQDSTGLAHRSGESLNEIVYLVDAASDQVRSIATASEQQASASEQINRSIEEVSTISSETAQAMTQAAQAVGELAGQTADLMRLIEEMQSDGSARPRALAAAAPGRAALN